MKKMIFIILTVLFINFIYSKSWQYLGVRGQWGPFITNTYMDLDGWQNNLYIVFNDQNKIYVYKYLNNSWIQIYSVDDYYGDKFISVYGPYIYIISDNYFGNLLSIFYFNGIFWTSLSSLPGNYQHSETGILNGSLYICFGVPSEGNMLYKYNGVSWNTQGESFSSSSTSSMFISGNNIYVFYIDTVSGEGMVKKWNGTSWTSYGSCGISGYINGKDEIVVASNGDIYVLINDYSSYKVQKYSISTESWATVGTFLTYIFPRAYLGVSGENVYLFFLDMSIITVYKYSGSGTTWDIVGVENFPGTQVYQNQNSFYVSNNNLYVAFKEISSNKVSVMGFIDSNTPTITPTITATLTATITPTITATPDIIYYRTTLSTWIEGTVYMDSPTGITRVSIEDRLTWFKNKDSYSVFAWRDYVKANSYLFVIKNDYDIEFRIVNRSSLNLVDCSSDPCLIHFSVFSEP